MKLRIKGNSVRLRLSKTEVANFAKQGYLQEITEFGNTQLIYALAKNTVINQLSAKMEANKITVEMPADIATNFTDTDEIGFQNQYAIHENLSLFLLVEKDFVCIDNTFEDQSDNYPNPNAVC